MRVKISINFRMLRLTFPMECVSVQKKCGRIPTRHGETKKLQPCLLNQVHQRNNVIMMALETVIVRMDQSRMSILLCGFAREINFPRER